MSKILIIEDDLSIRHFVTTLLTTQNYDVIEANDGQSGFALALSHNPAVIILDLGLPDMDGVEWIVKYRSLVNATIICVTARDDHPSKVAALDAGADDYLTKPFNPGELLARIRVAFRHLSHKTSTNLAINEFSYQNLLIDFDKGRIFLKDVEIHLTPIEYQILLFLAKNQGRVCTSRMIIRDVWGNTATEGDIQNLRVVMANLRRKIEPSTTQPTYILTVTGVGYRFNDE
ncbi:MAG: DNA-binding response regulator [Firmicutes bacterium HGW-Firmicutes-20]|jgi:two-component system KDP operon response regulator KdpE|nr:MAG: DNA-binding response regulator [Firmicutes bacterium HGW-Firmicutes-20]